MASTPKDSAAPVNPVESQGDHDRIVMPSVRVDGSLDQHNPELIGEKDATLAAVKEQFKQQAVAAVDAAEGPVAGEDEPEQNQSADVSERKAKHEAAEKKAESAAEKLVNSLHNG